MQSPDDASSTEASADVITPPWEELPEPAAAQPARPRVSPSKVKLVAEILGLTDGDEDEILSRLIDEFLAMKAS